MKTKKLWQSKVFWLNFLSGLVTLCGLLTPDIIAAIGISNPARWLAVMALINQVGNILLRLGNPAPIDNTVPSGTDIRTLGKYMNEGRN